MFPLFIFDWKIERTEFGPCLTWTINNAHIDIDVDLDMDMDMDIDVDIDIDIDIDIQ